MNINELYQKLNCPICKYKLTYNFDDTYYICPNNDYLYRIKDSFLEFRISDYLNCNIFNDKSTHSIIYSPRFCSDQTFDKQNFHDSLKKFSEKITFNTITNSKNIFDLKQRFIKLYTSAFI